MKKLVSLLKACMTDNMNLFKVKNKNQTEKSKKIIPIFLAAVVFFAMWSYANTITESLVPMHLEYFVLTLFAAVTSLLTLIEGVYKSSNLLFNCKDDDLLFSLPIKKSTILFIRIFKFYVFELLYNSLFLVPAMVAYLNYTEVGASYYIVSILAIFLLPIVPIVISCIIGFITTTFSSKFKFKNIIQIVITMAVLVVVFFASYNMQGLMDGLAENADNINETISKVYYPVSSYIKLVTDFNVQDLLIFVGVHILIFAASILLLSKIYFKINSNTKATKSGSKNKNYKIITNKPMVSLVKKELNKFVNTPVFVINAAFGLVLFVVCCVLICAKVDGIVESLAAKEVEITAEQISSYIPAVLFGLICMASFMSSITSSMISLEGKAFNLLKSLPIKPSTIISSKIIAAVVIMLPFILLGDIILFVRFNFNIIEILEILVASIILPLIAETIGILVNLKYPKMDAENDTEVIKQSMSSMVAVFCGMILTGITAIVIVAFIAMGTSIDIIISVGLVFYLVIYLILGVYLNKKSVKYFNKINV